MPSSMAFFATRPAAIMTLGFDVLVQEVIAAITTAPWLMVCSSPSIVTVACVRAAYGRAAATFAFQSCLLIIGRRYLQCEQIVEGIRYIGQGTRSWDDVARQGWLLLCSYRDAGCR